MDARGNADPLTGRVLGEFVVRTKLGEGGFGVVYRAEQPGLGREVVIKVLHARHAANRQIIGRFLQEAKLASQLEHPYTAHVYAFGAESDGLLWIAMELVHGTPLDKLLKASGPLTLERFAPLLDKICEVVHTAHESGIVHRDIKPANVMVIARAGQLLPKLLDFGIAKGLGRHGMARLVAGQQADRGEAPGDVTPAGFLVPSEPQRALRAGAQTTAAGFAGAPVAKRNETLGSAETVAPGAAMSAAGPTTLGSAETVAAPLPDSAALGSAETVATPVPGPLAGEQTGQQWLPPFDAATPPDATIGVVGSPAYMAPEQWDVQVRIDARADIYSIGVLAYEAITGRLPFTERGAALAAAHREAEVPSLGADFPAALDRVLRTALAKTPDERYQTALDLAAAFREGAGLGDPRDALPQLEVILRDRLLAEAPQPLAEAVANLGQARNVHQARDTLLEVFRVLVRCLGLIALGSRAGIGGGNGTSPMVDTLLGQLARRSLSEREWIELLRELCRPFAQQRDAYPVPELVSLFFDIGDVTLARSARQLDALCELHERAIDRSTSLGESELKEWLKTYLAQLDAVLRATFFLADYRLGILRSDHIEWWMGTTRTCGVSRGPGARWEQDQPVLADADGRVLVRLWPLVQVAEPSPGSAERLFLFEGKGRHGARLVAMPASFERHDETLWEWFRANLFQAETETGEAAAETRPPYPGLSPFLPEDAGYFFGREREAEAFVNRLLVQPLLAIVGASGAGKSSFVQAGVVPSLAPHWQVIAMRPGPAPLGTLAARLERELEGSSRADESLQEEALVTRLAREPGALGGVLRKIARNRQRTIVLLVDQCEELYTLCLDEQERHRFADAVAGAARGSDDPVRIVLTLRDDFLMRVRQLRGFRERLAQGVVLLAAPALEELVRIVTEPARRAGYEFDDPDLPREMAQEVADKPGALPLLAFTARRLWELRDRQFRQLRRKAYRALGGVGGALAHHADEMMDALPREEQRLVREAFRHLVTGEGTRAVLTRRELEELLGNGSEGSAVIERLVGARLLAASEGEGGSERIEIVHEALLQAWPRLVQWQREDAEGARLRDQLRTAARQWQERNRPRGLLWRDDALVEYQLWRARYPGQLTDTEEDFAAASLGEATQIRRTKRFFAGVGLCLLAIVMAVVYWQREEARHQLLNLYEEQGRQELLAEQPGRALAFLAEAYARGNDSPSLRFLINHAMQAVTQPRDPVLEGHHDALFAARFSPDGRRVVTASADGTAHSWEAATGKPLVAFSGHRGGVTSAVFSPDGRTVATASFDGTARLWDAASGRELRRLSGHHGAVTQAVYNPDGSWLVTVGRDGTARVWQLPAGQVLRQLVGHRGSINGVAVSPDGEWIATAGSDRSVIVWSSSTGERLQELRDHEDAVYAVDFGPRGLLVSAGADATIKVWDVEVGRLQGTLAGHGSTVRSVAFGPSGERLVSASTDGTVRVWDTKSSRLLTAVHGDAALMYGATFSPDGNWLVTASSDGSAKLWNVALEPRLPGELLHLVGERSPWSLQGGRLVMDERKADTMGVKKRRAGLPPIAAAGTGAELTAEMPSLHTFSFVTAKLDRSGRIVSRASATAPSFSEPLGDGVSLDMVLVPAGRFVMGTACRDGDCGGLAVRGEEPHEVLMAPFFMSKFEITQAQWGKVMRENPSKFIGADLPVEKVSWYDAMEFCERLSGRSGRIYRLPTEAEWEYACRAGSTTTFAFGDALSARIANFDVLASAEETSGRMRNRTIPVGSLGIANAFGLYDMHGNVWEWTLDWVHDSYAGAPADGSGWQRPTSTSRVLRGGSWDNGPLNSRCANRSGGVPESRVDGRIGFRVAMQAVMDDDR